MWNGKYGTDWKQQKDILFDRKEVDSIPQLVAELSELKKAGFFFRGQSDALFRVTSSIQRAWHRGEDWRKKTPTIHFPEFSKGFVKYARDTIMAKYSRSPLMDHEIWANLQHYYCPTPLIDFSTDPCVALHFATNHADNSNGYCSVYAMFPDGYTNNGWNDFLSLEGFLENAFLKEVESVRLSGAKNLYKNERFIPESRFEHWGFLDKRSYDTGLDKVIHTPKDGVAFLIYKNFSRWNRKIICKRMRLQKGILVYAPIEDESLEDFIFRKQQKMDQDGQTDDLIYQPLKCFDVPGRLVDEARRFVQGEGISNTSLGLEPCREENAARAMYGSYLNSLICKGPLP